MRLLESSRSHGNYLSCTLHPDNSSLSGQRFKGFASLLTLSESNNCALAISYQNSSVQNIAILIAHKSEETGFGNSFSGAELGLFSIPHSSLYNKSSILDTLQQTLTEKDEINSKIQKQYNEIRSEKEIIVQDFNSIKFELESFKAKNNEILSAYESRLSARDKEVSDMRNAAFTMINDFKESYEKEKMNLNQLIERTEREKNTAQMNYQSDLQNLKNVSKAAADKSTLKCNELTNEIDKFRNEIIYLTKQLREKDLQINSLKEQLQITNGQVVNHMSMYLDTDPKALLDMNLRAEREKYLAEMQEREMCIICCTEKKNTVCLPCGHFAYCNICLSTLGIELNKKIPKSHPHSRCSVCENFIEKVCKAFPY